MLRGIKPKGIKPKGIKPLGILLIKIDKIDKKMACSKLHAIYLFIDN